MKTGNEGMQAPTRFFIQSEHTQKAFGIFLVSLLNLQPGHYVTVF